jgi:hypothetical protein
MIRSVVSVSLVIHGILPKVPGVWLRPGETPIPMWTSLSEQEDGQAGNQNVRDRLYGSCGI